MKITADQCETIINAISFDLECVGALLTALDINNQYFDLEEDATTESKNNVIEGLLIIKDHIDSNFEYAVASELICIFIEGLIEEIENTEPDIEESSDVSMAINADPVYLISQVAFFSKKYLIEHRHDNDELQNRYDKQFAVIRS